MENIILASSSPRRKELLSQMGIEFTVIPSSCEEIITTTIPEEAVLELAAQKAADVAQLVDKGFIIGSDTIVVSNGQIMGKPKDENDAYQMLMILQGNVHQVYTGVCFIKKEADKQEIHSFYECTNVWVYPMDSEEIRTYIKTKDPMDKAGAYGIQGEFGRYIEKIEGEYNTVVGFPIARVYQELKRWIHLS